MLLNTKLGVVSLSGVVIAVTEARVGADVSLDVCVQLNCAAAELFAPDVAPLNAPAATSIVVAPAEVGVNVAVYVIPVVEDLIPLKLDIVPLETCISEASKFVSEAAKSVSGAAKSASGEAEFVPKAKILQNARKNEGK